MESIFSKIVKEEKNLHYLENTCNRIVEKKPFFIFFPFVVQKLYKQAFFKSYKKENLIFLVIGIFFYNIFAFMDVIMLEDSYIYAWKLRFFYLTPCAAVVLFIIKKTKSPKVMDYSLIGILLFSSLGIMLMMNTSQSFLATHYHSGIFILCLGGLLIIKISILSKFLFSISLIVLHLIFFYFNETIYYESKINIMGVLLSLIAISLVSAIEREINIRKAFIHGLTQEISSHGLQKKNKLLKDLSNKDELTNLANRRFFKNHLKRLVSQTGEGIYPIAVLYADIDNFKKYNDHYGHAKGDDCLKKVARILLNNTKRRFDLAARFGGEEFLIILPFTPKNETYKITQKIIKNVEDLKIEHIKSREKNILTISVGVSFITNETGDIDEVINQADKALYNAKTLGKNRVKFFS